MIIFFSIIKNYFRDTFSSGINIYLDEILEVYHHLRLNGKEGACAIFRPRKARKNETDILNIQFSIKQGRIGLDWILQNPINISQQAVFLAAAKSLVYPVKSIEQDGIKTLRVEGEMSPLICRQLLANLYNLYGKKTIKLYLQGIQWARKEH